MKDNEISHARLSGHEAGLSCGEVIPLPGLVCIAIEVWRLAVEDVGAAGQFDNLGFIVFIVTDIHHVYDFLAARDGHKLTFHIAQSEGPFLFSVLEVQRGGEGEVVCLARCVASIPSTTIPQAARPHGGVPC